MRKRMGKALLFLVVIAFLIFLECGESDAKNQMLARIGTSLLERACIVSRIQTDNLVAQVATGGQLFFREHNAQKQLKTKLVYMENQDGEKLVQDEPWAEEEHLYASGDSSAVVGENLAQIQTMGSGGAGTSAYVKKLRENKEVSYLWNHFYIIDSTTSVTKKLFDVEKMLERDMSVAQKPGKKQILIYHTHGESEAFANSKKGKEEDSIVGVGSVLAKELEKNGYGVYHDKTRYDLMNGKLDRSKAYNASLEGISKIMNENPDIQVTIDLHRDSVGKNKHTYTIVDGKKTAIVMFFNGMSRNKSGEIEYLKNPNREANLSFSLQLKCHAMELYDGFTKPIYLKGYRYNLHVAERALLVELGNENNSVEEAKNAAAPLARVIADVLKKET